MSTRSILLIALFLVVLVVFGAFSKMVSNQSAAPATITPLPVHQSPKPTHYGPGNLPPGAKWDETTQRAYVGGRLLIKFKQGTSDQVKNNVLVTHQATKDRLAYSPLLDKIGVTILKLPDQASETAVAKVLERNPNVAYTEPDYILPLALIPNDPQYPSEWHLPKIQAPQAWDITTGGAKTLIAIVDSGVDSTHPDLAPNIARDSAGQILGWNVFDNTPDTTDVIGHGTSVTGMAAAVSNNGIGVASPCWNCRIMPIEAVSPGGFLSISTIATGIIWAADHGARVANVSTAATGLATVDSAAQYMQARGGVVTLASGDNGSFASGPDDPLVLTVSATNSSDLVPSWSGIGNSLDLAAPGTSIQSTFLGGGYAYGTGTSASAPIVASVAALMFSVNPSLTPQQIDSLLKQSADKVTASVTVTDPYGNVTNCAYDANGFSPCYGYGRLNAYHAVQLAAVGAPPADTIAPSVSITSPSGGVSLAGTVSVTATASDNVGVRLVALAVDGLVIGSLPTSSASFSWNTALYQNGSHTLTAIAYDAAGNTTISNPIPVTTQNVADVTPPTTAITSPANGATVTGTITVQATASDNLIGPLTTTLLVDGNIVATDNTAPYSYSWNTTSGPHILTTAATDLAGNTGTSPPVQVTVSGSSDTIPPTVSFTAPANGATVSGTITVQITAADNVGLASVTLAIDNGTPITLTSPYSYSWDTTTLSSGFHSLLATARDTAGNQTTAQIGVTVVPAGGDLTPPTATLSSPTNGSTVSGDNIPIICTASDNVGVTSVDFYFGSTNPPTTLVSTDTISPYQIPWNSTGFPNGTVRYFGCLAHDAAGNVSPLSSVGVTVQNNGDTTAPVTTITSPLNTTPPTTVSGIAYPITANASDNVAVTKVEFYSDGVIIPIPPTSNCTDTISPYSCSWNTTSVGNGNHTLQTRAYDAAGNSSQSPSVTVNVQNLTQTTPIITGISATSITTTSAIINWNTNIPTTGIIYYRSSKNQAYQAFADSNLTTDHHNTLINLAPNKNYTFYIRATAGTVSATSGTGSFRTLR